VVEVSVSRTNHHKCQTETNPDEIFFR